MWLDVPPVLRAHLLVLHQVVADGNTTVRIWLHEGNGGQALGNRWQAHWVWVRWYICKHVNTISVTMWCCCFLFFNHKPKSMNFQKHKDTLGLHESFTTCACVFVCVHLYKSCTWQKKLLTHCFLEEYILGQLFAHFFSPQPKQFNLH